MKHPKFDQFCRGWCNNQNWLSISVQMMHGIFSKLGDFEPQIQEIFSFSVLPVKAYSVYFQLSSVYQQ